MSKLGSMNNSRAEIEAQKLRIKKGINYGRRNQPNQILMEMYGNNLASNSSIDTVNYKSPTKVKF